MTSGEMGAAQALDEALARMSWSVEPETFVLACFPRDLARELPGDLGPHAQVTLEPDEVTVLASAPIMEPLLARFPDARVEADLAWIRFDTAMGWEVVGFLAAVCGRLARAGVPLGAVCSFDRDHLFIARRYLAQVGPVLDGLFGGRAGAASDGQIR
ncbi:MAG: hypothetical protein ACI8QZ_001646 [Chlamydiales bacterium]|jgi:hypothetical protein